MTEEAINAPATSNEGSPSSPKAVQQPSDTKRPVSISKLVVDTIEAISLVECAHRSLNDRGLGGPEQVVLERAQKTIWHIHDGLVELPGADEDEDEDEENEEGEP